MKCSNVYEIFFKPGEVVEIRAYGSNGKGPWEGFARGAGIVYGYFDNAGDFGKCAEALDKAKAPGIYFTLNPVNPDLLARAANRLKAAEMKTSTTSDADIICLRWIYLDLDPRRPSGISSTKEELTAAIELRNKIYKWLVGISPKFKKVIPAVSGNGAHLMIRIRDLKNNEENVELIQKFLLRLHQKFSTDQVEVDTVVFNPSRICKVYGTMVRKGDSIETRPHRRSYIEPKFLKGE